MQPTKILIGLFTASLISLQLNAQEQFQIVGTLKGASTDRVFMNYRNGMKHATDTAAVVDGKFIFSGTAQKDGNGVIMIPIKKEDETKPTSNTQVVVFLEPGNIHVFVDQEKKVMKVGGTPTNETFQKSREITVPFEDFTRKLEQEFKEANGNQRAQDSLRGIFSLTTMTFQGQVEEFVKSNPTSMISLNLIRRYCDPSSHPDDAKRLFDLLSDEVRNSKPGLMYGAIFEELKQVEIGAVAPDFSLPDVNGNNVALHDFRGKYVLVDFWASWCGPCRRENPHVVAVYNKFRSKGFDVLGVSLDGGNNARDKWIQAIADDKLAWTQVSDLKGWESLVVPQYKITAIPSNFLLDPQGKIIAKNLRGADLEAELEKILNR